MCKLKSAIILKDRIFIPDYDSHSDMLRELRIEDTEKNAATVFVRAELFPKNEDVFTPIDEWIFKVDQDIKPDWFVESYEKERMFQAVKEWAKHRIHIGIDALKINSGANHYIKDCKNVIICDSANIGTVCGSTRIGTVCGSANIGTVCGSANIGTVCDSAHIGTVRGSAHIGTVYDSARIDRVRGSAHIGTVRGSANIGTVCGSAHIGKAMGWAIISNYPYSKWKNQSDLILSENATFKDNIGNVIYQSGDYKLVSVKDGTALKARDEE